VLEEIQQQQIANSEWPGDRRATTLATSYSYDKTE
jgi:hypothetical protein